MKQGQGADLDRKKILSLLDSGEEVWAIQSHLTRNLYHTLHNTSNGDELSPSEDADCYGRLFRSLPNQ